MSLRLYDPQPPKNDYVSQLYFEPMLQYAADHGIDCQRTKELVPVKGHGIICNADYLTPENIMRFKENDCPLFAFSCTDSAYLPEVLRHAREALLINRIFILAGVPNSNFSHATTFSQDFSVTAEQRRYLPEAAWNDFDVMRRRGTIQSLPYPSWNRVALPEPRPFKERRNTLLFRGGAHFQRVIAYLMALHNGCADEQSGFNLAPYFLESMNPRSRYCGGCRVAYAKGAPPDYSDAGDECTSSAEWGGSLQLQNPGDWNNRCPRSFLWLAEMFQCRHGGIDMDRLGRALHYQAEPEPQHRAVVGEVTLYADAKWEFTVNTAQRFWEGASVGTISLMPRRTNDQDYFPALKDGEHYLTFQNDFSDIHAGLPQDQFDYISNNVHELWKKWMKPAEYALSDRLLQHVFDTIETPL